jgi:choline-sulfatase
LVPFLTGAYGHPVVRTPHLDALAARGVRFDAAYTPYPLCAPARAAMITGRYASSFGCFDNAALFPADVPTVAHYLTSAGYATAAAGKMHFVGPDQLHGFDRRLNPDIFPAGFDWLPIPDEHGRFPAGGHAHQYVPPQVGVRPWTKFLSYDEETTYHAVDFIHERARSGPAEPYFLVASLHNPHDPFQVTREYWDLYDDAPVDLPSPAPAGGWPRTVFDDWLDAAHSCAEVDVTDPQAMRALRRSYYALVSYVDAKLGQIVDALDSTGQLQDSVVIVTSDHGDMLGERGMVQKRCFYEWSARVPLVVAFGSGEHAGRVVRQPVSLLDLAPTVLDLAGIPAAERVPMDGRSLLPLLAAASGGDGRSVAGADLGGDGRSGTGADLGGDGRSGTGADLGGDGNAGTGADLGGDGNAGREVFSEYHVEKVHASGYLVRSGRYKYTLIQGHGEQLFDLVTDPGETRDLTGDPGHGPVRDRLRQRILTTFDPDAIAAAAADSLRRRAVIVPAMQRNSTSWDAAPEFRPGDRYVR